MEIIEVENRHAKYKELHNGTLYSYNLPLCFTEKPIKYLYFQNMIIHAKNADFLHEWIDVVGMKGL